MSPIPVFEPGTNPAARYTLAWMGSRLLSLLLATLSAHCAVTAVHLRERTDVLGGTSFGKAGPYERITATVHFALDPTLPANQIISDLSYAPRNAQGKVEFTADLYVLRPRDYHRTNGTVVVEVPNRGNMTMLQTLLLAERSQDPKNEKDFGDRWLFEEGYVLAWIGWQQDVAATLLRLEGPATSGISGLARHEFLGPAATPLPFPPAQSDRTGDRLTARSTDAGPRVEIPHAQWHYSTNQRTIELDGGFRAGTIYELIYRVENPPIAGLGLAAVRDMAAYFKYPQPLNQLLADQSLTTKRSIGYGLSQSGRFLRQFIYDGFNADEQGRQVFDGLIVDAAGAGRGSFNHRFAVPGQQGNSVQNFFWPVDVFPFTDTPETDSGTGRTDGLLSRLQKLKAVPKIFFINSSVEYWARAASLITTTPDGRRDVDLAPSTRSYFIAGAPHSGAVFPPAVSPGLRHLENYADKHLAIRALLAAMQAWLADNLEPPPSAYPRRDSGELVEPASLKPPRVPGAVWPPAIPRVYRLDFGSQPPAVGDPFTLLVPQVDADGLDLGGVRLPRIAVPLGTFTGWNYAEPAPGRLQPLAGLTGSFLPFARTRAIARSTGDSRPSIEERYPSKQVYLDRMAAAARSLADRRLLLERDIPACLQQASREWHYVTELP